nr:5-formyltetrahydrofolate cyclo-ligase [Propionibacterium sp.]
MPAADLPPPRPHVADAKAALRVQLRARRSRRPDAAGAAFARGGWALAAGQDAVALYASTGDEPDTWELLARLHAAGVRVMLPVLAGRRHPDWAWYAGPDALRPGWHGILEPTTAPLGAGALASVSVVFCSALAATPAGDRLGGGGGWYDRALAHASGALVAALCFDEEVLPTLPTDPWDRRVDVVLTDRRTLRTATSGPE